MKLIKLSFTVKYNSDVKNSVVYLNQKYKDILYQYSTNKIHITVIISILPKCSESIYTIISELQHIFNINSIRIN